MLDSVIGIAYPTASAGFLGTIIVPLVIGFLIGMLVKRILSIGLILIALAVVLVVAGFLAPESYAPILNIAINNAARAIDLVRRIAAFIPYISVAFVIGVVLGFLKG